MRTHNSQLLNNIAMGKKRHRNKATSEEAPKAREAKCANFLNFHLK